MESIPHRETLERQPSIRADLELTHSYADCLAFSDVALRDKRRHYQARQRHTIMNEEQRLDVGTILNHLEFEIRMRQGEVSSETSIEHLFTYDRLAPDSCNQSLSRRIGVMALRYFTKARDWFGYF